MELPVQECEYCKFSGGQGCSEHPQPSAGVFSRLYDWLTYPFRGSAAVSEDDASSDDLDDDLSVPPEEWETSSEEMVKPILWDDETSSEDEEMGQWTKFMDNITEIAPPPPPQNVERLEAKGHESQEEKEGGGEFIPGGDSN